jgi:uncharacterized protein YqcC (DUF446 family)
MTMDTMQRSRQTADILLAIEAEMRQQGLWADTPPSAHALSSTMPFMYDTLKLHQWLQFVFLPRTPAVIESGGQLPGNCHIHPLAEYEFTRMEFSHTALLELIRQMDNILNAP